MHQLKWTDICVAYQITRCLSRDWNTLRTLRGGRALQYNIYDGRLQVVHESVSCAPTAHRAQLLPTTPSSCPPRPDPPLPTTPRPATAHHAATKLSPRPSRCTSPPATGEPGWPGCTRRR